MKKALGIAAVLAIVPTLLVLAVLGIGQMYRTFTYRCPMDNDTRAIYVENTTIVHTPQGYLTVGNGAHEIEVNDVVVEPER